MNISETWEENSRRLLH